MSGERRRIEPGAFGRQPSFKPPKVKVLRVKTTRNPGEILIFARILTAKPVRTFPECALPLKEAVFRPGQAEILAQRPPLIFFPEYSAFLEFRHHLVHEIIKPGR